MNSVLIIDDNPIIKELLEKIFSNMFFTIHTADDGEEGLELFLKHSPKLVVLDYNLPIVDGLDVLYTIRNTEGIIQPKIIFCTSQNSLSAIEAAIESGCDDYIIRPFDEEILALKLKILGVI